MNGPGDIPLTHSSTPDTRPCGLISIIPTLGMSSCRGRAEAFARRLSSKLRTLGSQNDDDPLSHDEDEPIINGGSANTWMTPHESEQTVTDLQPLRHESDSFFDFDCELESPGSPVDECEYLRLIETASNTPHNSAAESGYVCASAASSQNSSDGQFYDVENSESTGAAHSNSNITNSNITNSDKAVPAPAAEYGNDLKLNGNATLAERLSNGHNHQPPGNGEIHCDPEPEPETDPQTHTETETAEQLQDSDAKPGGRADEGEKHLTPQEMAKVQEQIISELQKHSEQVKDSSHAEVATPRAEETPRENEEQTAAGAVDRQTDRLSAEVAVEASERQQTTPAVAVHTITNGHSEDGEEVLKIEVTQVVVDSKNELPSESAVECVPEQTPSEAGPAPTSESQSAVDEGPKEAEGAKTEAPAPESAQSEAKVETPDSAQQQAKVEANGHGHGRGLSTLDTTDDEDDCRPQRVRRCSSLKTGKTPPGTPGRKKIVRFADVLGLDLADIKTFLDEVPTIPKSAFEDLEIMDSEPPIQLGPKSDKLLMPLFQQPGGLPTFLDLVREKQVSLENAAITDPINQTISGSVRVRNLDFHKSVHIRYTLDGWRSFADLQANYVQNSCDGFSDKFTFVIFGNSLHIGQRLEFAVRFQCKGQQFWDNNYGANYCFQCLPTSSPALTPIQPIVSSHHTQPHLTGLLSPTVGETWCSSFY